jgi:hypothetical protein
MRHLPIDAGSELCIGQTNVELSPDGWTALLPLAKKACRLRPDKILCSDLKRCQLLADAIAAGLGLFAEPDPIWREVSFGKWENRTWSDIQAREPQALSEWIANFDTVAPPAGESFEQFAGAGADRGGGKDRRSKVRRGRQARAATRPDHGRDAHATLSCCYSCRSYPCGSVRLFRLTSSEGI